MDEIDRISHHIGSLSRDMYEVKKTIIKKEKDNIKLQKRDKKRRESLKKAQKNFFNVSTNLKIDEYKKFEKKVNNSQLSKSAYIKKLILDDIKKEEKEEEKKD